MTESYYFYEANYALWEYPRHAKHALYSDDSHAYLGNLHKNIDNTFQQLHLSTKSVQISSLPNLGTEPNITNVASIFAGKTFFILVHDEPSAIDTVHKPTNISSSSSQDAITVLYKANNNEWKKVEASFPAANAKQHLANFETTMYDPDYPQIRTRGHRIHLIYVNSAPTLYVHSCYDEQLYEVDLSSSITDLEVVTFPNLTTSTEVTEFQVKYIFVTPTITLAGENKFIDSWDDNKLHSLNFADSSDKKSAIDVECDIYRHVCYKQNETTSRKLASSSPTAEDVTDITYQQHRSTASQPSDTFTLDDENLFFMFNMGPEYLFNMNSSHDDCDKYIYRGSMMFMYKLKNDSTEFELIYFVNHGTKIKGFKHNNVTFTHIPIDIGPFPRKVFHRTRETWLSHFVFPAMKYVPETKKLKLIMGLGDNSTSDNPFMLIDQIEESEIQQICCTVCSYGKYKNNLPETKTEQDRDLTTTNTHLHEHLVTFVHTSHTLYGSTIVWNYFVNTADDDRNDYLNPVYNDTMQHVFSTPLNPMNFDGITFSGDKIYAELQVYPLFTLEGDRYLECYVKVTWPHFKSYSFHVKVKQTGNYISSSNYIQYATGAIPTNELWVIKTANDHGPFPRNSSAIQYTTYSADDGAVVGFQTANESNTTLTGDTTTDETFEHLVEPSKITYHLVDDGAYSTLTEFNDAKGALRTTHHHHVDETDETKKHLRICVQYTTRSA